MNPEEEKRFLCVWLLYYVNLRIEVRRYRRMDIKGFNVVLETFSFDLKV